MSMTHDKKFRSAEDAMRRLIAARDTAGTVGSVTGRCVADGELGLTPDGDVFRPSAEDRIHMRRDLEMVMDDGMDRMMKRGLDVYLDCKYVRTYPEDNDGDQRPGAVDYVVYWRRCRGRTPGSHGRRSRSGRRLLQRRGAGVGRYRGRPGRKELSLISSAVGFLFIRGRFFRG